MKKILLILVCVLFLAGVTQAATPVPVSFWEMEEPSGLTAGDTMGLNPGNLEGGLDFAVHAVAGREAGKQALHFGTGAADVLRVPTSSSLASYDAMSFMCWVNLDSAQQLQVFVSTEDATTFVKGFCSLIYPGTSYAVYASDGTTPGSTGITGPALAVGEWHMLTYTHDGVGLGALYIDDSLAPVDTTAQLHAPSAADWLFGHSWLFGDRPMLGSMDEAAYWNVALSADEVREIYLEGVTIPEPATMALLGLGALGLLRKRR